MNADAASGSHIDAEHGPPHELSVRGLHVHYGPICALEDAAFTAHCGTRIGIYGPNGAGKSSLLKALAGLLPHAQGEVRWNGKPITRSREEIAYLPQREEADFNFPITVRGVVEMGRFPALGWFGRFRKRDREVVDAAIASMELGGLENRQIRQLSGGQATSPRAAARRTLHRTRPALAAQTRRAARTAGQGGPADFNDPPRTRRR